MESQFGLLCFEQSTRVIGDKPLIDITREDALEFRRWLWARIDREGLSPGSVNKDLTHISAMVRTVSDMKSLGIESPFNGLAFREKEKPRRRAFTVDWIRENLACADPLAEMNDEARDVLLAMVNTGCRPSEIIGLRNEHIRLDDNIPHIRIRADGRTIKTPHSARDIPLVGVSLDAMRRHPDGFPRYRGRMGGRMR